MTPPENAPIRIDLTGTVCPASLLLTLRREHELRPSLRSGEATLEVLTDNRDSVGTISESLTNMGYCVEAGREGDCYLLRIRQPAEGLVDTGG